MSVIAERVETEEETAGITVYHRPELLDRRTEPAARLGTAPGSDVTHFHQIHDRGLIELVRRSSPAVLSAHGYPGCTSGVYYFAPGQECTRPHGPGCVPNLLARGCAHTRYPRTLPPKYANVSRSLAALGLADLVVSYSSAVDRHLAANSLPRRAVVPLFPTVVPLPCPPPQAGRRVLFAGRLEHTKGVRVLVKAAREVDAEFVICGEGRELESLVQLTTRLGVGERVHFPGWLDREALAAELAKAAIVAVPSVWPEPFGLVGIEALAAGRPVVASATGGIPDWLEDGVGLPVRPGDHRELARALEELLSDPSRARTMGLAGQRLVAERFSQERHAEVLLASYRTARGTWLGCGPSAAREHAGAQAGPRAAS